MNVWYLVQGNYIIMLSCNWCRLMLWEFSYHSLLADLGRVGPLWEFLVSSFVSVTGIIMLSSSCWIVSFDLVGPWEFLVSFVVRRRRKPNTAA